MTTSKHVIVLSYDAFSKDNWQSAAEKPHLAALLQHGAYTDRLLSVYPTLTYVIHSSYVTGAYPDRHGIFHNNPLQPFLAEEDQDWHWYRKEIQLPTIYEAARAHGLTTASILWPVTGKAAIDYNIPEMKAVRGENQALKILKNGSKRFTLAMELKYGHVRQGIAQPYLDDFITCCTVETINKKKPHLLLAHLIDLDDTKHLYGTRGDHIEEVLERMDRRIGDIVQATKDAGIFEDTTFIIVGDHGQLDVRYKLHLNRLLHDAGLIQGDDWRAYVQAAGGAAYLYTVDAEAEQHALALLADVEGIEAIYDRDMLDTLRVEQRFSYMLEAKEGYCFDERLDRDIIYDLQAHGEVYATHGYSPYKPDYTSNLLIAGKHIKKGFEIGAASVVDLAPTIASLLGIPFDAPDGHILPVQVPYKRYEI